MTGQKNWKDSKLMPINFRLVQQKMISEPIKLLSMHSNWLRLLKTKSKDVISRRICQISVTNPYTVTKKDRNVHNFRSNNKLDNKDIRKKI